MTVLRFKSHPLSSPEDPRAVGTSSLRISFKGDALDFDSYETLIDAWTAANDADQTDNSHDFIKDHTGFLDSLAQERLQSLIAAEQDDSEQLAMGDVFGNFAHSAFVLNQKAEIMSLNKQATAEFGTRIGDNLDVETEGGQSLREFFSQLMRSKGTLQQLEIIRGTSAGFDRVVTLTVLPLTSKSLASVNFLVTVMDTTLSVYSRQILGQKFDLTEAELEIAEDFFLGKTLKEIATTRARAYATVRNQFQSIMSKADCKTQSDLLRTMLGLAFLLTNMQKIQQEAEEDRKLPERRFEMLRPNQRILDVSLFGAPKGHPIICLPSIFGHPLTPLINDELIRRDILFICVARPGLGKSSFAEKGHDYDDCFSQDIVSLLDNMGFDTCDFLGRASAGLSMMRLMARIPTRLGRCMMVNSMVPRPYVVAEKVQSKWTVALMSAAKLSPSFAGLILGAGKRLLLKTGVENFIKKMYSGSIVDHRAVENLDIRNSIARGVEYTTEQGLNAGIQDMIDGFSDWTEAATKLPKKLHLLHGKDDPHVPIAAVRKFASDHANVLSFQEVKDGGGLLNYTHSGIILDHFRIGPDPL